MCSILTIIDMELRPFNGAVLSVRLPTSYSIGSPPTVNRHDPHTLLLVCQSAAT